MVRAAVSKTAYKGSNPLPPAINTRLAQLVEHLPYKKEVTGPSPVARTIAIIAPLAQLDRAADFESEGRRFESCMAHHIMERCPSG